MYYTEIERCVCVGRGVYFYIDKNNSPPTSNNLHFHVIKGVGLYLLPNREIENLNVKVDQKIGDNEISK